MKDYFDPKVSHEEIRRAPRVMEDTHVQGGGERGITSASAASKPQKVVRYCYRPFDVRWLYWEPETQISRLKPQDYFPHV